MNRKITAEPNGDNAYPGRLWRPYAKVVFVMNDPGKYIRPEG
jgi:hypothetical protein